MAPKPASRSGTGHYMLLRMPTTTTPYWLMGSLAGSSMATKVPDARDVLRLAAEWAGMGVRDIKMEDGPEGNQSWGRPELAPFPGFVEQNGHSVDGGLMDPLSAIGLWALSLVGIGALVLRRENRGAPAAQAQHRRGLT